MNVEKKQIKAPKWTDEFDVIYDEEEIEEALKD